MEFNTEDFPENLITVFDELKNIREEVHNLAIGLVMDGELKSTPGAELGETYPYDYELYMNESIDPNVQALTSLLSKIDETVSNLFHHNKNFL